MKTYQQGATLIVVLVLLLVVTVIGVLAIRSSLTALNIATNGQAQQLLIQNSDAAIFNAESPDLLNRNTGYDGMFGYIKRDVNKGKELVFCYKGSESQFFDLSKASIMMWESGSQPSYNSFGVDGYCKLGGLTNFFTSGRKAVMTQVAVKTQVDTTDVINMNNPFIYMQQGTDPEKAKVDGADTMLVVATSILPALSSASDSAINDCFSKHMNQVVIPSGITPAAGFDKSVSQCLQDLGVPVNTQVVEYNLAQVFD